MTLLFLIAVAVVKLGLFFVIVYPAVWVWRLLSGK
jgi:hypothetical protein